MPISQLNLIRKVENIFCVYRNFTSLTKLMRILVCFQIFVELGLAAINCINKNYLFILKYRADTLYFIGTIINSTIIILLSCIYSKHMKNVVTNLNANDISLKDYSKKEMHKKTFAILNCIAVFICVFKCALIINYRIVIRSEINFNVMLHDINLTMCHCRNTIEYFVMCSIFCIMSQQLKAIIKSIEEIITTVKKNEDPDKIARDQMNKLMLWNATYIRISEASVLFNIIFRVQVSHRSKYSVTSL